MSILLPLGYIFIAGCLLLIGFKLLSKDAQKGQDGQKVEFLFQIGNMKITLNSVVGIVCMLFGMGLTIVTLLRPLRADL